MDFISYSTTVQHFAKSPSSSLKKRRTTQIPVQKNEYLVCNAYREIMHSPNSYGQPPTAIQLPDGSYGTGERAALGSGHRPSILEPLTAVRGGREKGSSRRLVPGQGVNKFGAVGFKTSNGLRIHASASQMRYTKLRKQSRYIDLDGLGISPRSLAEF